MGRADRSSAGRIAIWVARSRGSQIAGGPDPAGGAVQGRWVGAGGGRGALGRWREELALGMDRFGVLLGAILCGGGAGGCEKSEAF